MSAVIHGAYRTVLVVAVLAWASALGGIAARGCGSGASDVRVGFAVEVRGRDGGASILMFSAPPDVCVVLNEAGLGAAGCVPGRKLKPGRAVLGLPGGGFRVGLMSGGVMVALGVPVPVNLATADEIAAIDGIGPAKASAIVSERVDGGPYSSPDDLARVKGIGPVTAKKLGAAMSFESDL
jgi:competence protein ComEA